MQRKSHGLAAAEAAPLGGVFSKRVPLALSLVILLQGGGAIWWAASKDSGDRFQQQRIEQLEQDEAAARDTETQILERLARIEERVNAETYVLDQIEKQTETERR